MSPLYRLAVRAYPPAFRRDFERELERIFEQRVSAARRRSPARAVALSIFLVLDAVWSGLAERARARHDRWAWPSHGSPSDTTRSHTMTWDSIRRDIVLAFRQMRQSPTFAALTVASLALGIGANAAIFAVVNSVLLQPLPYGNAGELVMIWSDNTRNNEKTNPVSPANYEAFKAAPSLAGVEAMYSFLTPVQVRVESEPEAALVSQVTPGMFTLLQRSPILGRTFDDPGAPDGAVLSYNFWKRRFGGDPSVVGRTLQLSGGGAEAAMPILGVMPPDFTFPYGSMLWTSGFTRSTAVDMWWTMSRQRDFRLVDASGQPNRGIHYFGVIGRTTPGQSIDRVRADLAAIAAQRAIDYPDTNVGWGVTVRPLHEQTVGPVRPALLILLAGVGVVLLITCINVANVLLARAAGRGRDLAIRSALGASRARLIQQTLTESTVLAVIGGLAGLAVMQLTLGGLLAAAPPNLPRVNEVQPGWPVVIFAFALALVAGIAVGLIPASAASRSRAQDSLRDGTRTTASRARGRTRAALIVAEVALAMILTVGGGLLLRSFISVVTVDPGFNPERLLTMQLAVPARYSAPEAVLTFYDEVEARLRALPGVSAVGGTTRLPLGSTSVTSNIEVEGRPQPRAELPEVEMRRAVFDYFETMQIPVLRGRTFAREQDRPGGQTTVVINEVLAERIFPGQDPLGKRIRFASGANQPWLPIVGVVGSIKHGSLEETPKPEFYIYYRQGPPVGPFVVLRTSGDPADLAASVRQVMRELGADPPRDLRTMDAVRSSSVAPRRFVLMLVGIFGVLALGLAALGVFGVVTLIAAERTAEVGIRLALGATPSQVMKMMLAHSLRLAAIGIAIGAAVSLALSPWVESQLFGVGPTDPVTYVAVALALVLTATIGAYVPARRAMSVDPATALRQ